MSHPPTNKTPRNETESSPGSDKPSLYRTIGRTVRGSVETLGFWTAVTMPFLHLPLLFSGLERNVEIIAFLSLVTINAIALLIGHQHGT